MSLLKKLLNWVISLYHWMITPEPKPITIDSTSKSIPADIKPEWLKVAELEKGVSEVYGSQHNPRIIEYHSFTSLKATEDEVPWCSAFACFCMEKAGLPSTRKATARSWSMWGYPMKGPELGAVTVFWRGKPDGWQGHVGFYIEEQGDYIFVLGGNQGDKVSVMGYPKEQLLGYRWPVDNRYEI